MINPYDMIERLMAIQPAPADWDEYHAGQETIKAAVQVIGEQADEIERLQTERRWIPVSERLPENQVDVLVTDGSRREIANYAPHRATPSWPYEWFTTGKALIMNVTHWQPLPEGPEAE